VEKIRAEQKFSGIEQLRDQLMKDRINAQKILSGIDIEKN